jgi:ketosteroid isomerase-like protein
VITMESPFEGGRRETGMKTVIRTMFVVFLLLVGPQILSQMVASNLSAVNPSPPPLISTEQEAREFFTKYIDLYNKKELEQFLLLFSVKAKQNQRDGLSEMKMIYSDLFNRSQSLQLSTEDMKIEIYQNAVEIKARYSVHQVLKEGREKRVWKGDARWVLVREEGKLEILTIDYKHSIPIASAREGTPEPATLLAKEEDVKQFFSNYIDRYNQKDINGFLSFFSSKAVQNQKDGFTGIRTTYTKFFDESQKLRYQVEGMKIEIYPDRVEVKARFNVNQILKRGEKEKVWTGTIGWVLGREDGVLKIMSLDYQNDKTPSMKEEAEKEGK